jgi:hypothetical protein
MRSVLLALLLTAVAPLAMTVAGGEASAAGPFIFSRTSAFSSVTTPVDYRGRRYYRGYGYYPRRPVGYGYGYSGYVAPRAYYGAPAYYAPPVVYYPPPVVYYPPPVVYGGYPVVAPYGYGGPDVAHYRGW